MSDYTPVVWNPGAAPGISADNLNHLEGGVQTAHSELTAHAGSGGAAHADASASADGFMTKTMVAALAGQQGDHDGFTLGTTGSPQPTLNSTPDGLWRATVGRFGGWIRFEIGATPGVGSYRVSLPIAPSSGIAKGNTPAAGQAIGTGWVCHTSEALYIPVWIICGTSNLARILLSDGSLVSVVSPFTFDLGDEINLMFDYPIAL